MERRDFLKAMAMTAAASAAAGLGGEAQGQSNPGIDPALETAQRAAVADLRSRRDRRAAAEAIDALQQAAAGTENLMPRILDAVEARATLGEVSDALRAVFGVYRESVVI